MKKISRFVIAISLVGSPAHAAQRTGTISCASIVNNGWSRMPDVTDYVKAKPNAAAIGYSSACRINSLVFAQCFLEPEWSVGEAADALIHKAIAGKPLPDRRCGA